MRRTLCGAVILGAFLLSPPASRGAENFSFDLVLRSPGIADFDANPIIDGQEGEEFLFTADMILSSSGLVGLDGPQAWSISLWHAGVDIVSLSVKGTVSARESEGGLVDDDPLKSFIIYEIVDPARNGGREGIVQAVAPATQRNVTLPPNTRQVVGRNLYRARIETPGVIAFIRYEDGLIGSGQPVTNVVSRFGQSHFPSLGQREITIGKGAVPEAGSCGDGFDNDGDGWTDCNDPDCRNDAACGIFELCTDFTDNDGDGLVDCADPDCQRNASCQEVCGDGVDNDRDGLTDCRDAECVGLPPCPIPEACSDGVDNDEDGLTDCDDADCRSHPACRVREDCRDGVDNDGDGRTDCDDADCAALSSCRGREACRDGIDNDLDGRTDCDDVDCAGISPCPPRELCEGGVDEDGDGLVDCKDPSCESVPPCGSGGFDFVLATEGSFRERATPDGGGAVLGANGERNVVELSFGSETSIEVVIYIVPFPEPQPEGVQGWSLSIAHNTDVMELDGVPTVEGSDAHALRAPVGFEQTELADSPGEGGGAVDDEESPDGFISAVVLALTEKRTLDQTRAQSVARATYLLRDSLGSPDLGPGTIRFQDGLRGSGQPVPNNLTLMGSSVRPIHLVPLEARRFARGSSFVRGDPNDDGRVDLADAIWSINELVRGGPPTVCRRAADVNADGRYDLSDPIYLLQYEFLHGPVIRRPFPSCGAQIGRTDFACPEGSVSLCP